MQFTMLTLPLNMERLESIHATVKNLINYSTSIHWNIVEILTKI